MAEFRSGHWDAAVRAADEAIELRGDDGSAFPWLLLAVSHARRGEPDEARAWYARARPAIDGDDGLADIPRWLIDEAKSVLGEGPPGGDAGADTPPGTPSPPQ